MALPLKRPSLLSFSLIFPGILPAKEAPHDSLFFPVCPSSSILLCRPEATLGLRNSIGELRVHVHPLLEAQRPKKIGCHPQAVAHRAVSCHQPSYMATP